MADLLIHGQVRVRCGHVMKGACRDCIKRDLIIPLDARIEGLEKDRDSLHAAITVFEAGWDTGGYTEPHTFWLNCWRNVDRFLPPEHQSLVWAVEQQERDWAAAAKSEEARPK